MRWFAGSDHAGFHLKQALVKLLRELGDEVTDFGADDGTTSVDYPDYAQKVGVAVVADPDALGLLVCGSGLGVSIAANKVHGIRAARVTEPYSARMAREHNQANVVCFGERVTGVGVAEDALRAFREGRFAGGRHQRRVDKIAAIEKMQ